MGNPISGPGNTPVNQTPTNSTSRDEANAQAQFGDALAREQCPPGLHRPSRWEPPCNYLRPPGQEPPKPDKPVGLPPYTGSDVPKSPISTKPPADDYKPIPEAGKKKEFDPPVYHTTGQGEGDGAHIGGVKTKQDWGQQPHQPHHRPHHK